MELILFDTSTTWSVAAGNLLGAEAAATLSSVLGIESTLEGILQESEGFSSDFSLAWEVGGVLTFWGAV